MMYKNSIKLIFSNFHLVWKLLVYFIICILFVGGLNHLVSAPILENLGIPHIISRLPESIRSLFVSFDLSELFASLKNVFDLLIECVVDGFVANWDKFLILLLLGIVLPYMVFNFYLVSTCNVLHNYMGSCVNFGFTASIFVNFWKNLRYNLVCLVTILPLRILTLIVCFKVFVLFSGQALILKIFAPFIVMAIYVLLTALRVSLFSGWVPYMVVKNAGVWASLVNGFRSIRKRLLTIFANSIGVVLTIVLVSVFGILTFGVSMILTIPASFLFVSTFNMVALYSSTGLRFYVDNNNVFAPKKTEMVESFKIYKNLI